MPCVVRLPVNLSAYIRVLRRVLLVALVFSVGSLSQSLWADDEMASSLAEEEAAARSEAPQPEISPPINAVTESPESTNVAPTAVAPPAGNGSGDTAGANPVAADQTVSPAAEPVTPTSPEVVADLPKAENVDLKEVISRPLHEALPLVIPETKLEPPAAATELNAAQPPASIESTPSNVTSVEAPSVQAAGEPPAPAVQPIVAASAAPPEHQPLRILGAEVLAGTATRLAWSVKDSLAGISTPTPVLVVHGVKPGPVVCLTAAVHGDELNGIETVRRVLYDLQPDKLSGTVIGVPIVNLQGFRRASRYLPDRRDLNRYFPGRPNGSSAARIAHSFFTEVIVHCNMLVDLHTGSFRRTNLPQLRADLTIPSVAELTQNMGAIVVLQSKGARGSLRRAAVDIGIPAVTVEAGEPLNVEPDAVQQGVRGIESLLSKLNMYPYKGLWARKTEPVYYKSRWVRAPTGGIMLSEVRLGARVTKGQTLGTVTDPITNMASKVESPTSGRVIGMALNQIMLPGFAAYHIGYQATVEEAAQFEAGPDETVGDDEVEEGESGEVGPAPGPSITGEKSSSPTTEDPK